MKIAYFDCFSGLSGDMILGALIDSGVSLDHLKTELGKLNISGYELKVSPVLKKGIGGTKVDVIIPKTPEKSVSFSDIKKIIITSGLSLSIKNKALKIFERIGQAEAKVHQTSLEEVHFHEIGAVDSIIDIVGAVIGLELLNVDLIYSSPLNTGQGTIKIAHGEMPVPAPATAELLIGFSCYANKENYELTTPTGAAIITTLAHKFCTLPEIKIKKIGYGAGTQELSFLPNLLRLITGEMESISENIILLETNIDEMNPQIYDYVMEQAFNLGAIDVFFTPIQMKKNRPAVKLSLLVNQNSMDKIIDMVFKETTTLGIRKSSMERFVLERKIIEVETKFGKIQIKLGIKQGKVIKFSPEYVDCKKIAEQTGVALKDIYTAANEAYLHSTD